MVRAVWGLLVEAATVLYTLLLAPPLILIALISPRVADRIALLWCRLVLRTAGARVEAIGLEGLPQPGSYVVVANHQSYFDVCALVSVLGAVPRFVTKKELVRVPIFGPAIRALGQIIVDRADPESAKRAIDAVGRSLARGVQICFFAEGTRSPDGRIGPFKKGAAAFALRTGLPVVPASISGTRKFMPKGSLLVRPGGRIRVVFGGPVQTVGLPLDARDRLTEQLRAFVIREFDLSV